MSVPRPPERPEYTAYPSDAELEFIEAWPIEAGPRPLFEYVQSLWNYPDFATIEQATSDWDSPVVHVTLVTGGWSGNESIIGALQRAGLGVMWGAFWLESKRGGYFKFEIPEKAWSEWGLTK